MPSTEWLDLSVNNLQRLPSEVWRLPLRELNLSHNQSLGRTLLKIIEQAAQCEKLEILRLRDVVKKDHMHWDQRQLCKELKALVHLKFLDIRDNELDYSICETLGAALPKCQLRIITFPITGFQEGDASFSWDDALTQREKDDSGTYFNLSEHMIRDEGATLLAPGLRAMKGLMGLYLSLIQIYDKGATQIAAALKDMQCLTALNLDANHIRDDGAREIVNSVKHLPNLHKLRLDDNEIGDSGVAMIVEVVKEMRLSKLALDENLRITQACRDDTKKQLSFIPDLRV